MLCAEGMYLEGGLSPFQNRASACAVSEDKCFYPVGVRLTTYVLAETYTTCECDHGLIYSNKLPQFEGQLEARAEKVEKGLYLG